MKAVHTFLMFQDGRAEEAMKFYTSIIEDSEIIRITKYGANEPGEEGTVNQAIFTLKGQQFMCIDSSIQHAFDFTPSVSIYLTCDTEEELDEMYHKLSEGGEVLMPLGDYGFSKKFGWINDRFGISWQLNLPN